MEKVSIELPTMYGDHHVVEVRRILFGIAGVEVVYASSGFQMVEINYDQEQTSPKAIKAALANAGYTGELPAPLETETEIAQGENNEKKQYFRHTAVYEQINQNVSFAQNVAFEGRPLWPCPGMEPIKPSDE